LREVNAFHAEAVAKAKSEGKPEPTLLDTYEAMNTAKYKGYTANPAKLYQDWAEDWNKMKITAKMEFQEQHPEIKTPEQYADFMTKHAPQVNPRGRTTTPPDGAAPPVAAPVAVPVPPPTAIAELAKNPTDAQKANFDAVFGPGAAAKALANK
jgi:hypothetical protein